MRVLAVLLCATVALAGCAGGPSSRPSDRPQSVPPHEVGAQAPTTGVAPGAPALPGPLTTALGAKAAEEARALIGAPYRYGGRDPSGFDCSGLVWYVYQSLGVELPRSSRQQRQGLAAISRDELEPGDLVFFSSPVDHVGIYLGAGDFVHAPRRGKRVSIASLDAPYFQLGFAGAARVVVPQ